MIFKMTVKHLLSRPWSSFMTLCAVSAALTLLGTFWTVVENLERVQFQQKNTAHSDTIPSLTVFVDSRLSAGEVDALKNQFMKDTTFSAVEVVTAEDALKSLEQQFGETLSKVFGEESLPITLRLQFRQATMTRQELVSLLNKMRALPGVLDIDDGMTMSVGSETAVSGRLFSWATGLLAVVFLVVALLVSHLIRLAFESLRSEVETMKVIGASNRWILLPLLMDGLFMGVAGSVLSLIVLLASVQFVLPKFSYLLLPKGVELAGLSASSSLFLMGLAVGASILGSLLTWPLVIRPPQEV